MNNSNDDSDDAQRMQSEEVVRMDGRDGTAGQRQPVSDWDRTALEEKKRDHESRKKAILAFHTK